MSLTVKAYFYKSDGSTEIRRFSVDQDVTTSFVYLSKKIHDVFPGLQNGKVTFYWTDSDGDAIAFSSDEELISALSEVQNGVFKMSIKVEGDEGKENFEGAHHVGVVCDVCESPVVGIRYKCVQCPDYDLCMTCEKKGNHPEHRMVRMVNPRTAPFRGGPFAAGRGPAGPCYGPGAFGGPGGCPPWMFRKCVRNWMKEEQKQKEQKGKEAKDNKEAAADDGASAATGGEDWDHAGAFLRNMGEQVAAMLDPFGIDVDIDIEHKGERQKCGKKAQGKGAGKKQQKKTEKKEEAKKEETPAPKETVSDVPKTEPEPAAEQLQQEPATQDVAEQVAEAARETSPASIHQFIVPTLEQPGSDQGWTLVNPSGSDSPPPPARPSVPVSQIVADSATVGQVPQMQPTVPTATNNLYPAVPQEPEPIHPDPRVNKSLQQMMSMGFSNEGNWLAHLLEAKQGDISQVLDAMQPARRN